MKLDCHVISVEDIGDGLRVTLQGKGIGDAKWRSLDKQVFIVATNNKNRRAYYIGRRVSINVSPQP